MFLRHQEGVPIARQQADLPAGLQLNPVLYRIGKLFFRLCGWRLVGSYPADVPKAIILLAPHTSNWDFLFWLFGSFHLNVTGSWLAKHTIFRIPILGHLLRAIGGVPIDRRKNGNFVEGAIAAMNKRDSMIVVLSPEGTRKKLDHWRSGFYHMALGAGVPVLLGYADYAKRTAGICGRVDLTGDMTADLARIRTFYDTVTPYRPENLSEVRLVDSGHDSERHGAAM